MYVKHSLLENIVIMQKIMMEKKLVNANKFWNSQILYLLMIYLSRSLLLRCWIVVMRLFFFCVWKLSYFTLSILFDQCGNHWSVDCIQVFYNCSCLIFPIALPLQNLFANLPLSSSCLCPSPMVNTALFWCFVMCGC